MSKELYVSSLRGLLGFMGGVLTMAHTSPRCYLMGKLKSPPPFSSLCRKDIEAGPSFGYHLRFGRVTVLPESSYDSSAAKGRPPMCCSYEGGRAGRGRRRDQAPGLPDFHRGQKDNSNRRILHSGSKAQDRG